MTSRRLGWVASLAAVITAGTWWGVHHGKAPWPLLLLALLLRRSLVAPLLVVALLASWNADLRTARSPALEAAAERVERCDLQGRVIDVSEKLGSVVAVDSLGCPRGQVHDGAVVIDEATAEIGSPVAGEVLLSPLGDDGFDVALRRMGAGARAHGTVFFGAPSAPAHRMALDVRAGVRAAADRIGGDPGALMAGLTVGDTAGMSAMFEDEMRAAGLSHLVAVSGSNVALVTGSLFLVFGRLGRPVAASIAALGLAAYVVVVGPDPSVLRAAAMGGLGLAALASGRRTEPVAALAVAVAIVLIARPPLVDSVGLHLSVAATAGLILWSGPWAARLRGPRVITLPLAVTLAAQVAVAPVLIAVFGEVSLVGPLANLLAAPAVAPATVLGLGAGLLETFSAGLGAPLAIVTAPFVRAIVGVGHVFGSQSWAAIEIDRVWAIPLGVLVVGGGVWALRGR